MFASGVDGDTTTVLSDMFALDEAPEVPTRLWFTRQPCCATAARQQRGALQIA